MFSTYLILIISFLFALFLPFSFLLLSKLLRPKSSKNHVKNAPYESGEETIGYSKDIYSEYTGFFPVFLSFEVIIIILIFWASVSNYVSYKNSILLLSISVIAVILSLISYKLASGVNE